MCLNRHESLNNCKHLFRRWKKVNTLEFYLDADLMTGNTTKMCFIILFKLMDSVHFNKMTSLSKADVSFRL